MKTTLLFLPIFFIAFFSKAQIDVNFKFGPSLISKGDIKGIFYEIGVNKNIFKNLDLEIDFSNNQFSKIDEFYYETVIGGSKNQSAIFKHIVFVNQLGLNGKFHIVKKKIKLSISGGGAFFSINSSTPRSYTILYPLFTGNKSPLYQINYDRTFKTKGLAPNLKLNLEHTLYKKTDLGLGFNFTYYRGIMIWSAPITFRINLD